MASFQPPGNFDFADPTGWPDWLERFQQYRLVVKLHKDDADVQIATLLYSMGPQANVVLKQLVFDNVDDKKDYEKVLEKLTQHFHPVSNVAHERAMFERAVQNPTESADEFLRRLHRIAEKCSFKEAHDERIRDRFMANLLDSQLTLELQLLDKPDLAKAATHTRNYEQVRQQVAKQRQIAGPHLASSAAGINRSQVKTSQPSACHWCGHSPSHAREDCPAQKQTCSHCGKQGHYSTVCLSKSRTQPKGKASGNFRSSRPPRTAHSIQPHSQDAAGRGDAMFLGSVAETHCTPPDGPWMREVRIGSTPVLFKVDTGADTSVITAETFALLVPKPTLTSPAAELQGPDGSVLALAGRFR